MPRRLLPPGTILARLELVASPGVDAGPELVVVEAGDGMLQVLDPGDDPLCSMPLQRIYNPRTDKFSLAYTTTRLRSAWTIMAIHSDARLLAAHPFANRQAAFDFQQLVTGHVPFGYCERASVDATLSTPFWRQNKLYHGKGELQLWCSEELAAADALDASPASTATSLPRQSVVSMSSVAAPSVSVESYHSPRKNKTTFLAREVSPPLLVAFVRDKEGYNMLRVESKFNLAAGGRADQSLTLLTLSRVSSTVPELHGYEQRPDRYSGAQEQAM